jgi:PAS domain S-box-containing protein
MADGQQTDPVSDRSMAARYGFGVASFGTALLVSWALFPWLGHYDRVVWMTGVGVAARFGGLGPGLLATVLGLGAELGLAMSGETPVGEGVHSALFLGGGVALSALSGRLLAQVKAHEKADKQLRALAEAVPNLVWTCRPDWQCDYLNSRWSEYSGRAVGTLLRSGWLDLLHPDDRARALDAWGETELDGSDHRVEVRLRRHDGIYRWFNSRAKPMRGADGRIEKWYCSSIDVHEERQLRERLAAESERLHLIASSVPGGTVVFRGKGGVLERYTYASPGCLDVLGVEPERLCAEPGLMEQLVHPEDFELAAASLREAARAGRPWLAEFRVRHPRKGEVWLEARGSGFEELDGARTWYCVLTDVTGRKHTEFELAENRLQVEMALEMAGIGVWKVDVATRRITTSPSFRAVMRFDHEPTLDEVHALVHPADAHLVVPEPWPLRDGQPQWQVEHRVVWPDGATGWIDSRGIVLRAQGKSPVAVAMVRDITGEKQSEQALRDEGERIRAIIDCIPVMVWSTDPRGEPLYANARWDEWAGRGPAEMRDFRLRNHIHPEDADRVYAAWDEGQRGESPISITLRAAPDHSSYRWYLMQAVPYFTEGRLAHWFGSLTDIDARVRMEDEIRRVNAELEARVAARTRQLQESVRDLESFAYSVAHDLRAPLRSIDGWSLALLEDCGDRLDQRGLGYLGRVREQAQRMGVLIDDLLALSRVARVEMQVEEVDLSALALRLWPGLLRQYPGCQAELRAEPGLMCAGDPRLLEIALTNLLDNAIKFSARRELARVELSAHTLGGEQAFFVRDNGVGFDMAYANLLFGAFQRLHRMSEFPGNGIGLATVERVVRRHGGRVWAESDLGHGATFYFTIGDTHAGTSNSTD